MYTDHAEHQWAPGGVMHFAGPFSLDAATSPEWLVTNGLGGYASATLSGMCTRRYHGLLVAALHPPGGRTVLVSKLEEAISVGKYEFLLGTNQYSEVIYPHGFRRLEAVEVGTNYVIWRFAVEGAVLEKRVAMVYGENTTCVTYANTGPVPYTLRLTPLVNARDFHGETASESIPFHVQDGVWDDGPSVQVRPEWMPDGYWLYATAGAWEPDAHWHYNMLYAWEHARGLQALDNHYAPGRFVVTLAPGDEMTVTLSTTPPVVAEAATTTFPPALYTGEASDPPEVERLYHAALSFLVRRSHVAQETISGRTVIAGYHWFGDWGRDTMIALPGLCLSTRQYAVAADILLTFAAALRNGLLPNLFLDSRAGEAYNTVDASLWFVYAVDRYYDATGDAETVARLRPALEEIIRAYRDGTDFGIGMDSDALIIATAPGWQLTWMDAKVGDWVVTPRMGKPVEINALWYNALRVMESFSRIFGWGDDYGELAEHVRIGFDAFWHREGGYLYDVLAPHPDASIRPNQIFAVSLPYSPLDLNRATSVVETVERSLLTPYGLRSLAPHHPDYRGQYGGDQWARDGAYHQGTVWGWLIGPFIDAYLRVHGHAPAAKTIGRRQLQPLLEHLWHAGVGSVSEIFEGDSPHLPCGTISQAWSVSELLRAWEACREE